ncbi:MAG: hypothetical protein ACKVTZ_04240 [Bacteroidia bacterium]
MEEELKKEDLVSKYSGKPKPYAPLKAPVPQSAVTETKSEYKALVESGRAGRNTRFRIVDHKGNSYGSGYAHLMGWLFTPPDVLTINTTTHIFTIEGQGLEEIERALMDEKIRELREYNAKTHTLTGEEKTVIQKLDIVNRFEEKS